MMVRPAFRPLLSKEYKKREAQERVTISIKSHCIICASSQRYEQLNDYDALVSRAGLVIP